MDEWLVSMSLCISEPVLSYFYPIKEVESILLYFYKYLYSCVCVLLFQKPTINISTGKKNKTLICGVIQHSTVEKRTAEIVNQNSCSSK